MDIIEARNMQKNTTPNETASDHENLLTYRMDTKKPMMLTTRKPVLSGAQRLSSPQSG
jgi:hypothetical protein